MSDPESIVCELVETPDLKGYKFLPAEIAIANGISAARGREQFLLGRLAAHRALYSLLGDAAARSPILRGTHGEPLWPKGIVGSISHTRGAAVAVVAPIGEFESIGVDLELADRVISEGVIKRITLPAERHWVTESKSESNQRALQVFCAKESIYKAYFPLTQKFMTFKDAFVRWEEEHQAFVGTLLSDLDATYQAGDLIAIHCSMSERYVMCCAILPKGSLQILPC